MLTRTTSWQHGENHERFQNATEEDRRKLQKKMANGRTAFDIIDRKLHDFKHRNDPIPEYGVAGPSNYAGQSRYRRDDDAHSVASTLVDRETIIVDKEKELEASGSS